MIDVTTLDDADADYPTQDHVDRRAQIAIIASLGFTDEGAPVTEDAYLRIREFRTVFEGEVARGLSEAVSELAESPERFRVEQEHYQIGPAADSLFPFEIVNLIDTVRNHPLEALSAVADGYAVIDLMRLAIHKIRRGHISQYADVVEPRCAMPIAVIEGLCEDFIVRTRKPQDKPRTTWYSITREYFAGYISPAHPSESMKYLVVVKVKDKTYCFVVQGNGHVESFYLRENGTESSLPPPDLLAIPA